MSKKGGSGKSGIAAISLSNGDEEVRMEVIMRQTRSLLLIFGIIAVVFFSCQKQPGEEPHVTDAKNVAASADGVPIHFKTQGQGDMALVFVHGWCTDMSYWDGQIPSFRVYYQVVTLDLAGHGRSGQNRQEWTIMSFAQDVRAVIEKLDLYKVVLIGHSLGGPVILEAARLMPERVIGLVGADTFSDIYLKRFSEEEIEVALAPFRSDFAESLRLYVLENYFRSSTPERLKRRLVLDMAETPKEVGIGAFQDLMRYDAIPALQEITVPIRSINADRPIITFRVIRGQKDTFRLKFMANVGHFLMIEDSQGFNRILADFLGQIITESYKQQ